MSDVDRNVGRDVGRDVEPGLGELFSRLTDDLRQLTRQEIELAKVEIKAEVARAGKGAGLLSAGGIAGLLTLVLLSFAAAWGLENLMDAGLAFLIVGAVWGVTAAVLALAGKKQLSQVSPVPEQTIETLQEDAQWAKTRLK